MGRVDILSNAPGDERIRLKDHLDFLTFRDWK